MEKTKKVYYPITYGISFLYIACVLLFFCGVVAVFCKHVIAGAICIVGSIVIYVLLEILLELRLNNNQHQS